MFRRRPTPKASVECRRRVPSVQCKRGALAVPSHDSDGSFCVSDGSDDRTIPRRTLAGATILQIVPKLEEEPAARTAVNIAHVLLLAGARALVAAEGGPLVNELTAAGGEWIPMVNATVNPLRLRRNAKQLEQLVREDRIDIIHAYDAGAAWSARVAASRIAVWLVATLPDDPSYTGMRGRYASALAQGDRVIAPSNYSAAPIMKRYGLRPEQITIVPRVIDTATYNPAAVSKERADAQREHWHVAADEKIVMVPGRVAPWNGQILVPGIARAMIDNGISGFVFVVIGESTTHAKYARDILKRAHAVAVGDLIRMMGHCEDMPAAMSAADYILVPAIEAPLLGRVVAQAQAMGRPVVTSDIGVLSEQIVAPPRMPEDVRTGWTATLGDSAEFAQVLGTALSMNANAYRVMSARARQFAEYMFSPESVAEAMRSVYTSLLARDL
ncbi:MAG: glycosyltransferase [Rhizobiales bacterium]|nr:glycosyltransferase [Hyphomicrobiales bacterium]